MTFGPLGEDSPVTDDNTADEPATLLHSLVHGVVALTRVTGVFGGARRKLEVVKVRALAFSEGLHDYAIHTGGLTLYPRMIAADRRAPSSSEMVSSALPPLDALLGGGVHHGASVQTTT